MKKARKDIYNIPILSALGLFSNLKIFHILFSLLGVTLVKLNVVHESIQYKTKVSFEMFPSVLIFNPSEIR